jgi:hypothetical protein
MPIQCNHAFFKTNDGNFIDGPILLGVTKQTSFDLEIAITNFNLKI